MKSKNTLRRLEKIVFKNIFLQFPMIVKAQRGRVASGPNKVERLREKLLKDFDIRYRTIPS